MSFTSSGSVALALLGLALAGCAAPLPTQLPAHLGAPPLEAPLPGAPSVGAPSLGLPLPVGLPVDAVPALPGGLDQDVPGQDCSDSENGTRSHDNAGDEVVEWAGCIGANVPVFRDPSLGTGPDAEVWVPWHTAGMVAIVHLHGSEPLNVTITKPDDATTIGLRDAGAGNRDSLVRFEVRSPEQGSWKVHGEVQGVTALRAWTITVVLQPAS